MPVLLAHVFEDSTDIFGISGGGVEHPKPPPQYATAAQYTWMTSLLLATHVRATLQSAEGVPKANRSQTEIDP